MMRMISRFMVIMAAVVMVACGRGETGGAEATPVDAPIELHVGERTVLQGSGPTEEAPTMTVNVYITDAQSGDPVVGDVLLDGQVMGRGQSVYTLILPAQFEGVLGVKADGYKNYEMGIRYTMKRSRTIDAPVKLEKESGKTI